MGGGASGALRSLSVTGFGERELLRTIIARYGAQSDTALRTLICDCEVPPIEHLEPLRSHESPLHGTLRRVLITGDPERVIKVEGQDQGAQFEIEGC